MKKQLLVMSALALCAPAFAQPSLNSANTNPVVGEVHTLVPGSWISEGSAGANQTWNFASLTTTASAAVAYSVQTVSPGNASVFPNANIQLTGSSAASLLKTGSTALQNFGTITGTVQIKYSDAEDQLRYPCAMGDTYTDTHAATFSNAGSNYFRKGTTTVTADAYGTLQLPGGTYSNVLRLHMIQDYSDSTNFGGTMPYVIDYYNDQYMWYLPNNHLPIFSAYALSVNGGSPTKGSTTLQSITNSIAELEAGIRSVNLYPNPASSGFINIDLNLEKNLRYTIVMTDNIGREVMKTEAMTGMEGYNFQTLNTSGIESGLYQVSLKSDNGRLLKTMKIFIAQ